MSRMLPGLVGLLSMLMTASVTTTRAADMPIKAPSLTPPSWTGLYLGAQGGGAWGGSVSYTGNDLLSALLANGAAGFPGDQPLVSPYSLNRSGPVGGLEVGYNWQASPNILLGVEADISFAAVSGTATGTSNLALAPVIRLQSTTSREDTEWYGTLRGRLGWLATPNLLVFGTGGLAYGRTSVSATDAFNGFVLGVGGGFTFNCPINGGPCFAGAGAAERTGWTAGGGTELRLDAHWTAKVEYLFVDLGTQQLTVTAIAPTPGTAPSSFTAAFRDQMNVVRVGLNYRF
jgi:outer membrane immunogenic protein